MKEAKYYAAKMGVLQNFEILLFGASTDFDGVFRDSIRLGS